VGIQGGTGDPHREIIDICPQRSRSEKLSQKSKRRSGKRTFHAKRLPDLVKHKEIHNMGYEEKEDTTAYKVVVNHEEQYSIWPADRENALGWRDVGETGTKAKCRGPG
jgi:uncharacterized protein YbdZ (MbtH family)